jgi:hypothetical protein
MSKMLEQAKEGNLVVGGADWLAQKEKLAATAAQYKQVQDLRKEYTTMLLEKPDQAFIGGKTGIEGVTELQEQLRQIQAQEGLSNAQRINEMAKVMEGVRTLPMGVNEAINQGRETGFAISEELQNLGVTSTDVTTRGGQYVITNRPEITPELQDKLTEEINSLTQQYLPYLEVRYKQQTPQEQQTVDGFNKYVEDEIKAWLFPQGKTTVTTRRIPQPKSDRDSRKKLTKTGDGKYENSNFVFVVVDEPGTREGKSVRGKRKGLSGKINVQSKSKAEELRSFTDADGDKLAGRLTDIKLTQGTPSLIIRTAQDAFKEIPIGENFAVLEEFYFITEEDIKNIISQGEIGDRKATSRSSGAMRKTFTPQTSGKKPLPGTT